MKRYLIIFLSAAWIIGAAAPVTAVEKKKKSTSTQQVAPKKSPPPVKKPSGRSSRKPAPKYDDFVDKNHNGIDDRKETTKIKDDQRVKPKTDEKKTEEKKPGQ